MAGTIKTQSNTITVAFNSDVSSSIDTRNRTACGLVTPEVLTNASIKFEASFDGVSWYPLMEEGGDFQYTITVSTNESRLVPLNLNVMQTVEYLRLKFSNFENEQRTFILLTRIVA